MMGETAKSVKAILNNLLEVLILHFITTFFIRLKLFLRKNNQLKANTQQNENFYNLCDFGISNPFFSFSFRGRGVLHNHSKVYRIEKSITVKEKLNMFQ